MKPKRTIIIVGSLLAFNLGANQVDIQGPAGSGAFGSSVAVLPNGNFVVTDPSFSKGSTSNVGAVYLYSFGGSQISVVTGSTANDSVGSDGITVLPNGNFVIRSSHWHHGANANAGAVTWISGTSGLSGVISATNSLIGTHANDAVGGEIGNYGITVLNNGNYVVVSWAWANGSAEDAGAVTWANGNTGIVGAVSSTNSLVGTSSFEYVGSGDAVALTNGNYVVGSESWSQGSTSLVGAATWVDGTKGLSGPVSAENSLIGTTPYDEIGTRITALTNGNYVVTSPNWANGTASDAGAVTLANGATGLIGTVSAANSLVGTHPGDNLSDGGGVTALTNGNFVVTSSNWNDVGAATWVNGSTGAVGPLSATNSLVGSTSGDAVGTEAIALTNGNYVVVSSRWANGTAVSAGAVTWANGTTGIIGPVSVTNSLVGSTPGDSVGDGGVAALANGNYVVASPSWSNGSASQVGAATWADGSVGISGLITASNSLTGTSTNDVVGVYAFALANGNYVVASPNWANGSNLKAGAATWADGSAGLTGLVSPSNSLVGTAANDSVGDSVIALSNGNYIVESAQWANGAATSAGAITWANGRIGFSGPVSSTNSLVGSASGDQVGYGTLAALPNGNYAVASQFWANGANTAAGAVSFGRGNGGLVGPITSTNSVLGTTMNGGSGIVFSYDSVRDQLIVGQPASNTVSLFKADELFQDGFD